MHSPRFIIGLVVAALAPGLTAPAPASPSRRTPVVLAVEKALPSVVNIGTERIVKVLYNDPNRRARGDVFDQFFSQFFGAAGIPAGRDEVQHSLGSGVLIDPSGYILTNHHVIERASVIRITLMNDETYTARFIAGDEVNDLALIKIDPKEPLPCAEFARDGDLMLGETVIALGNPFGLGHTVTVGVLSAKNREARSGNQVLFRDILQTDAAVNPGSSGGPLLNIDGRLIGISVAIYQEAQNIGFALPVHRARLLLAQWLAPRTLNKLNLGLDLAEVEGRVRVTRIEPGGPAAGADLKPDDRLLAVNGRPVATLLDVHRALLNVRADEAVNLSVERAPGEARVASFRIAALPRPDGAKLAGARLGVELGEPPAGGRIRKGLQVLNVRAGSVGERTGLRPGLLLTRINDRDVQSIDDIAQVLENVKTGDPLALSVVSVEEHDNMVVARTMGAQIQAD